MYQRLDSIALNNLISLYVEDRVFQLLSPTLRELSTKYNEITPVEVWSEALSVAGRLKNIKSRRDIVIDQIWSEMLEKYRAFCFESGKVVERDEESSMRTSSIVMTTVIFMLSRTTKDDDNPHQKILERMCTILSGNPIANYIVKSAEENEVVEDREYGEIMPQNYLTVNDGLSDARVWFDKIKACGTKMSDWFLQHYDQFVDELLGEEKLVNAMQKKTLGEPFNMKLFINICGIMIADRALNWSVNGVIQYLFNSTSRNQYAYQNKIEDYDSNYSELTADTHNLIRDLIRKYNISKKKK